MQLIRGRHGVAACLPTLILLCCWVWSAAAVAEARSDKALGRGAGAVKVNVFYMTNRQRHPDKPAADTYSGDRGQAHFGRCEVEFTPIPLINQVADKMPFYVKSETNLVSLAEPADPQQFWEQLAAELGTTTSGSVVLFVHGYNYGFERTCRMAAEMQRYLQGEATVLVFSWPSNGLVTEYMRDQADMEWSVPALAGLIAQLGDRIGTANVQVVAHSLGSRGVIFALQRLGFEGAERPAIGHLVLLAPDFDAQSFVELLPGLETLTGGITLYASNNDAPLKLSRQLSGYPRLGEAGEHLTVVDAVDTIDVSSIGRYQITGHEYFYFHPRVTADLVALLSSGERAAKRPGLQRRLRNGIPYWEFKAAVQHEDSASGVVD